MKKNTDKTYGYIEKSVNNETDDSRIISDTEIIRFGERLQSLIGKQSYRAFAEKCGMSEKVIRNYVKGITYPSLDRLASIAATCGVSREWLAFGSHGEDKNTETIAASVAQGTSTPPDVLSFMLNSIAIEDKNQLITLLCNIGIKGVLQQLQQPSEQPESAEEAIRALNIRESLKDAICMALPGDEYTDREILRGIESRARGRSPDGSQTPTTPDDDSVKKTA